MVAGLFLLLSAQASPESYRIVDIPTPDGVVLEVGGMEFLPDGRPIVCTRRGQVWIVDGAFDADAEPTFTLFAEGLQEPLGLLAHEGSVFTVQRGELSRMRDVDGDDVMDELWTVSDPWRISGNYHEYNFGPALADDGSLWITTNKPFGAEPFGRVDWRGYALRFELDGSWRPMCSGLRSPAGIGKSPAGELFYTDNQGEWCGASKMSMLREGSFHGHPWGVFSCEREEWSFPHPGDPPDGILMPDYAAENEAFELPAVWFPYDKTGRSPAGFAWDQTGGAFGPFEGQVFVGDQYAATLNRVYLERVNGRVQGAVFPFLKGLASGVTRVRFAPDGSLMVGMTDRGWTALGTRTFGLQRVVFDGTAPFEIAEMRAVAGGFELLMTADVDAETAGDAASYSMSSYTYELHASYGSAEMETRELSIAGVTLGEDGRTVRLAVDGLRAGYVHELHADGLRAKDGRALAHADAYYTLIEVPGAPADGDDETGQARPTRRVEERMDDGKVRRVGVEEQLADGTWRKVGPWQEGDTTYDLYGYGPYELERGEYVAGEREGLWLTHGADGNAVRRGRFAAGLEEGEWTWFHPNGQPWMRGSFEGGIQVGEWVWLYADGSLQKRGRFDHAGRDQGPWTWWHENGAVQSRGSYQDGAAVGLWREWHANGNLASEGELVPEPERAEALLTLHDDGSRVSHREGPWREWWPNGKLRADGEWRVGERVAPHRFWNADGEPSDTWVAD